MPVFTARNIFTCGWNRIWIRLAWYHWTAPASCMRTALQYNSIMWPVRTQHSTKKICVTRCLFFHGSDVFSYFATNTFVMMVILMWKYDSICPSAFYANISRAPRKKYLYNHLITTEPSVKLLHLKAACLLLCTLQ